MTAYTMTKPENGGWYYALTVSNTTLVGWRFGEREEVEAYLKRTQLNCEIRAAGGYPHVAKDGTIRSGLSDKRRTKLSIPKRCMGSKQPG